MESAQNDLNSPISQPITKNQPKSPKPGRTWIIFGCILIVGILLRVVYINSLRHDPDYASPQGDMAFHDYWARALVTDQWTSPPSTENPHLDKIPFLRPPGYPYFLALIYKIFGIHPIAPRIVQALLGLISCWLAFRLGSRMTDRPTGLIWSAMMAGYWLYIYFESELNAPVILVLLLMLLFWILSRWLEQLRPLWLIAAGVVSGIAALFAPNLMLLAPLVTGWLVWVLCRRKRFKRYALSILLYPVLMAAAIAPATIRNLRVADECILISCNGPITFYAANNENSDGVISRIPNLESMIGVEDWSWFQYPQIVRALSDQQGHPLTYTQAAHYFNSKAWDYIRSHPGKTTSQMLHKARLFWAPVEIAGNKDVQIDKNKSAVLRYCPGFNVFFAFAWIGLVIAIVRHRKQRHIETGDADKTDNNHSGWEMGVLMAVFVVVYFLLFLPFLVSSRFRAPVTPLILLAAAFSLKCYVDYLLDWNWKKTLMWLVAVVAVFFIVSRPVEGYSASPVPWHIGRGEAYLAANQPELALEEFNHAIELGPDYVRAYNGKAIALTQLGRYDQVIEAAGKAISLGDHSAAIHGVLGMALINTGKTEEGAKQLQQAVRINPDDFFACHNLGVYYLQIKDYDHAVEMFQTICRLRPDDPKAATMLAQILIALKRNNQAVQHLQTFCQDNPDYAEPHFLLGMAYLQMKKSDLAKTQFERCLEIDSNFPKARDILKQLNSR